MPKHTKNLTSSMSLRLRHDQHDQLVALVDSLSDEEKRELEDIDQSRLRYPEIFRNTGRTTNYKIIIMRLAIDDYLQRRSDER